MKESNILNFTAAFSKAIKSEIHIIPCSNLKIIKEKDFIINYYDENKNFLFKNFVINNNKFFLFLSGFFYEEFSKSIIEKFLNEEESATLIANHLNGSYNAVIFEKQINKLLLFTDIFGYQKLFYRQTSKSTIVSSSFWNIAENSKTSVIDYSSICEHLILGHSLNNKTLVDNINLVPPGEILTIYPRKKPSFKTYYSLPKKVNRKKQVALKEFFDLTQRNFNYVNNKSNQGILGISLTGGGDTRVILNSLLKTEHKFESFTGYDRLNVNTLREKKRTKAISKKLNVKHNIIDFGDIEDDLYQKVLYISNGFRNGHWMASLSISAESKVSCLYYGFDGDVISGSAEISLNTIQDEVQLARKTLQAKTYYSHLDLTLLSKVVNIPFERFLNEYFSTYKKYNNFSNYDTYFFQEKNERSFRRISSFADGSKLGVTPINFFHDINIVNFYRSLPENFLSEEKFHHYAGSHKNLVLMLAPSANRVKIPHFLTPISKKIIPSSINRDFLNSLQKKKMDIVNISNFNDLVTFQNSNHVMPQLELKNIKRYIDFDQLFNSTSSGIAYTDFKTLISRLIEIEFTLKKLNIE